jgi:PIN domain nuclease of toxin-antitoxin system
MLTNEPLLLDTHVWIWVAENVTAKLSTSCAESIRLASRQRRLLVSAISVWEVANLDVKKRISLYTNCLDWVYLGLKGQNIELVDLSPEIAIDSTRLPEGFHADPADRILIATARNRNAILVTADRAILEYSRAKHVRVLDARAREGL